jgi:putative endopeptidase
VADLADLYPMMGWDAYLDTLGVGDARQVIVPELGYVQALGGILREASLETIRNYLTLHTLANAASWLSEEIEASAFAFDAALSGASEQPPLGERVLDDVNDAMQDAVGQLYVAAYFPPEAKARIEQLVDELVVAFAARIARVDWMTDATRAKAREKLDALGVKVGYPDTWDTYEDVAIGDSYAASMLSAMAADRLRNLAKFGEPVDRSEWGAPAQLVNAFYNPVANDITFPAAILQPPFFDYQADPASNYGGIGYVIGHEITHGFDRMGSQFDADGNLANWWTEEDLAAFERLNQRVVEQYSAIEVLPGVFINGQITVGENVADLGGVQVAWDALTHHLDAHDSSLVAIVDGPLAEVTAAAASPVAAYASPVASPLATPEAAAEARSLTQRERFFIAAATVWRIKARDEAVVLNIQTDEHAPARVRATLPSRNTDAFHDTFGVQPGDAMYLAPEDRIVVW